MGWLLPTFVIIFGIILTATAVIFYVRINTRIRRMNIKQNSSIIDCTTKTVFTNGYSMGYVINEEPCPNNTYRITFYPSDREEGEDVKEPEPQTFIVAKEMLKRLPKGAGSTRRERLYVLSRNPSDIPEHIRETEQGQWLKKEGQLAYLNKIYGTSISAGDEALEELMKTSTRVGITKEDLKTKKELIKEILKFNLMKDEQPDTSKPK